MSNDFFHKPKLIAVVGPTASGKTSLGLALARRFGGEIISADSRQIYRGMNIGTAKAPISYSPSVRAPWGDENGDGLATNGGKASSAQNAALEPVYSEGVPHYLLDIRDPDEDYSVGEFKRDAEAAMGEILSHGKLPILVGGTGLYVRAVVDNLDIPEVKPDPKLRRAIEREIATEGLAAVFKKLVALDPEAAYIVDPRNPRRVVRALEVATLTGQPFTAQRRKKDSPYDILEIGLNPPPELLRERIDQRIDQMLRDGLVDEVKILLKRYGSAGGQSGRSLPTAFDAIGYREIIDALAGRSSMDAAITAMKFNTWHFAKRQITWLKKDKKVKWIENESEAEKLVKKFLV
jgi:tRNA dimethylallyltransferase